MSTIVKIIDQHQAESYDKWAIQTPGRTAGLSETYRVESRRGLDEKMFFLIFTPWPSTKILADSGLGPALVEPISFHVKKNLEIIQATSAQTSTEETRQTKEPKQYDSHSTPGFVQK